MNQELNQGPKCWEVTAKKRVVGSVVGSHEIPCWGLQDP